jgi:hypothetical protein
MVGGKMKRPNLFDYATSELSQDAIIGWLLSWSNPEVMSLDKDLHNLSRRLLKGFFDKHNRTVPATIHKIEIHRQYKNVDIVVLVNDAIVLLIEDKIHIREHSDQLARYIQVVKDEGFLADNILPIYLQTGEQGDYNKVQAAGFVPFLRQDLLDLLKVDTNIRNDILNDYILYLTTIESQVQSFKHLTLDKWNWYSWQGFYKYLKDRLGDGEWDYVPNPRGGFLGFWWYGEGNEECEQYLQLEEPKLCFKIAVYDKSKRSDFKWQWHERFTRASVGSPLNVIKPVLRDGECMTVAIVEGDYRRTGKDGLIDLDKTMEVIQEAQKIHDRAVEAAQTV